MHFANVGAVVARIVQQFDPTATPTVRVFQNSGRVRKVTFEQTCSRRRTRRSGDVALIERDSFADQAIQVRRVHVGIAQRRNGIKPLLVRDDENDVGAGHSLCLQWRYWGDE